MPSFKREMASGALVGLNVGIWNTLASDVAIGERIGLRVKTCRSKCSALENS
jgi:hypothetical protein